MQLSAKTRILNFCRRALMNNLAERALARLTRGKRPGSVLAKLIPNYYLYAPHALRSFELYGYRWADLDISDGIQWYLYFGLFDPSHEALLALCRAGDVVLDVGANIGVTALRMSRAVGPTGVVYAFEPDPASYAKCVSLCEANQASNVLPMELAVSNKPGIVHLAVRDPNNLGMNQLGPSGHAVASVTLDTFVEERKLARIDVIKMDVEGHECSVLEGAREVLAKFRPRLFIEFDDASLRSQGRSGDELLSIVRGAGYVPFGPDGRAITFARTPPNVHFDLTCEPT
jgi:FkbM family methyltransferase